MCGTSSREGDRYSQNGVRADARLCGGAVERDHRPIQFRLLREDPASKRVMKHSANIRCRATATQPLVSPGNLRPGVHKPQPFRSKLLTGWKQKH